jgi:hypothetical protein
MNGQTEFVYYYPNRVGRIIFQAMQEVIGHNELNAVLNLANLHHLINNYPPNNSDLSLKFCELSSVQSALEGLYGQQGGRGLAMRMGRVSGGKYFNVEETLCIAKGDATWTIDIYKEPLD